VVVAVGLIGLEHRELGVVVAVDPFVAEVPSQFEDAVDAPDHHPLEVELERDPELHRDVERVVVGRERPRVRTTRDRLEDRALELDEATLVEHTADRLQHRGTREEHLARLLVGDQVEVPTALLEIRVLESGPFLGKGTQRLREHRPPGHEYAELACAGRTDRSGRADDVAEVHFLEQREVVHGKVRGVHDDLEVAVGVAERREHELAHVALQHDAAGDRHDVVGLGVGGEVRMLCANRARPRRLRPRRARRPA
jgi:hypothetical protein